MVHGIKSNVVPKSNSSGATTRECRGAIDISADTEHVACDIRVRVLTL